MDTCDIELSADHTLNEQIALEVFDALPEQGVIVAIMGCDGTCWSSDSQEFARLGLGHASLAQFRARIDDGVEPVVLRRGDTSVVMAQLTTEHTNCGYVLVALPHCATRPAVPEISLLETLVGQVSVVARLVEKNRLLMKARIAYRVDRGTRENPVN
jgi:hypothetical protein